MTQFNDMQLVKRRFFAMRNGILSDTYRRAGSPYKIIFGLNLPQIREIAAEFGFNEELSAKLWADSRCRESVILAPLLADPARLTRERALAMIDTAVSAEAIDMLCIGLLKKWGGAPEIVRELSEAPEPDSSLRHYAAMRLAMNLSTTAMLEAVEKLAETVSADPSRRSFERQVSAQVADELAWRREEKTT